VIPEDDEWSVMTLVSEEIPTSGTCKHSMNITSHTDES
jgi:hypothetical protein